MIVAIHQPMYLPWLGFFHKMRNCDIFVLLDDVQFTRSSTENRNLIKTPNGILWLTVPVRTKGRFGQLIRDVEIDNSRNWAEKHLKNISQHYQKAKFFEDYAPYFEGLYSKRWEKLAILNLEAIRYLATTFHIQRKVVLSSSLNVTGESTSRLVSTCQKLGADTYFSGTGAKAYLDESEFTDAGIRIVYQEFRLEPYPQLYGRFTANLSAIDYLLNCGSKPFARDGT